MLKSLRRDVAQFGSALSWGGRGREFKSHRSDHLNCVNFCCINKNFMLIYFDIGAFNLNNCEGESRNF